MGQPDWEEMKLPLPEKFTGKVEEWEEWSWQVKSYISLFHPEVTEVMDSAEIAAATVTDEKLTNQRTAPFLAESV